MLHTSDGQGLGGGSSVGLSALGDSGRLWAVGNDLVGGTAYMSDRFLIILTVVCYLHCGPGGGLVPACRCNSGEAEDGEDGLGGLHFSNE